MGAVARTVPLRLLHRFALAVALLLVAAAWPARADSWAPPTITTYTSANGQYRLTVVPRDIESQLAYFQAKSRGETLPEPEGPLGRFERLDGGEWVSVWSRGLVNEVAPVQAIVSDDGRHVVTFDNWHSTGHGDHVVVIYGDGGALVRSLRLDQIVPAYFIDGLPASVSSIQWQSKPPRLDGDVIELTIAEPDDGPDQRGGFPLRVALADGGVAPIAADVMARLGPAMCKAHVEGVRSWNAYLAYQRADLVYPGAADKDGWDRYVANAILRLKPAKMPDADDSEGGVGSWMDEMPFELLDRGAYMASDFRKDFRLALVVPASEMPRRWFTARDQDAMLREIEGQAGKIKPGQLAGVEMLFLTDQAHWARISALLAHSGARLTLVDIAVPVPPRPDDVARLPPAREIDPACGGTPG